MQSGGKSPTALPLYERLRRNPLKLSSELRWRVGTWLADKPARRELWAVKEAFNRVYRVKGRPGQAGP